MQQTGIADTNSNNNNNLNKIPESDVLIPTSNLQKFIENADKILKNYTTQPLTGREGTDTIVAQSETFAKRKYFPFVAFKSVRKVFLFFFAKSIATSKIESVLQFAISEISINNSMKCLYVFRFMRINDQNLNQEMLKTVMYINFQNSLLKLFKSGSFIVFYIFR